MLNTLRTHADSCWRAASDYAELEKEATIDHSPCNLNNVNIKCSIRPGRDCMGLMTVVASMSNGLKRRVLLGRERRHITKLTHPQWVSGLITIASEEHNSHIQAHMFKYLAFLQQDVCDFGFQHLKGDNSLILIYIEEGKASWNDLPMIADLRESNIYRSQFVKASTHVVQSVQTLQKNKPDHVYDLSEL